MTELFMYGCMVDLYRAISVERNFLERIKAPFFLGAALAIEII